MNSASNTNKMKVEVWSDIMCPFCYIGKRNYETALKQFNDSNHIEIVWKSFQLDPSIPSELSDKINIYQYLAERKGISYEQSVQMHESVTRMADAAGLEYNFDKSVVTNSFKAHRIIQMAKTKGLGDQIEERLFLAYFTQGKDLGDTKVLIELGKDVGLTETEVNESLSNDDYSYRINLDIKEAREIGVRGVPFFVFNRRYAISGAQSADVFLQTIEKSFDEWRQENPQAFMEINEGPSCTTDGSCD